MSGALYCHFYRTEQMHLYPKPCHNTTCHSAVIFTRVTPSFWLEIKKRKTFREFEEKL